jgi:hypothetical protein
MGFSLKIVELVGECREMFSSNAPIICRQLVRNCEENLLAMILLSVTQKKTFIRVKGCEMPTIQ